MRLPLLTLLFLMTSAASAAPEFTPEMAIQAIEASDAADETRLTGLLAPEFVAIRGRGEIVTREQYLSDLRSLRDANRFAGLRRDWTDVRVRVHDSDAKFVGRATWKSIDRSKQGSATASSLVTQSWRRMNGEWRLALLQTVRLGLPPEIRSFASGELQLRGMLFVPEGQAPHPAIVYAHGNEPDPSDLCESVAPELVSRGYVVWCPHRRGAGLSQDQGENLLRRLTEIERREGVDARSRVALEQLEGPHMDDLTAAVAYARTLSFVDSRRVFLMGNSFGGVLALLAAERNIGIVAAADFAGGALNWERSPLFRDRLATAARNAKVPVFLGQATNDFSTGPTTELGKALSDAGKVHRAIVYPPFGLTRGEGHGLGVDGAAVWAGDVLPFFEAAARGAPAPAPAAAAFENLRTLVGEWEGQFANGRVHRVTYRLTAAGTVLMETWALAPGRESLTLYHLDGAQLIATHYCPLGNQPTLRLASARDNAYQFDFQSATNLAAPNAAHQHAFEIRLLSADRFWRSETYREGEEVSTEAVEYVRVQR